MFSRRRLTLFTATIAATAVALVLSACTFGEPTSEPVAGTSASPPPQGAGASTDAATQAILDEAAAAQVEQLALGSLLAEIRVDGEVVAQTALGEAMGGSPLTPDGRFRNGAVAITYVSTVLLRLAEEGVVDLDAPIAEWLPDLRDADQVTPRMLATMTSGYHDHVGDEGFEAALAADPFRAWTNDELIAVSVATPRLFPPGENWDYSHAGYVILGEVLEAASGSTLDELIAEYVLDPLELHDTVADQTPAIPAPAVHAFTAERGIWEDATFWNPSWTLPEGAVETTTISDMAASFDALAGRGELLEAESYAQLLEPLPVGFGAPLDGCRTCMTLSADGTYGLGVFHLRDWLMQSPSFAGYASAVMTLPAERTEDGASVTVAVAITYTQDSFDDWRAGLRNHATDLARDLSAQLVPDNPPPGS